MHTMRRMGVLLIIAAAVLLLQGCAGQDQGGYSGMDYLKAGDYETAVNVFLSDIEAGDTDVDIYRGLGIAYMGLGRYDEATTALEASLTGAGPVPGEREFDINYYLGTCYYKCGEYEKALAVYDAIVTLRPKDADARVSRGYVKIALGDADGMDQDFRKAIELDPSGYARIVQIYQKMAENGYSEQGRRYLAQVLEQQNGSIDDYNRGMLSYYAGDYATAKTCLEKTGGRSDYRNVILLGKTYEALGDFNYATSVYETFVAKDQTHAEVYNQLGLCYMKMDKYEEALMAFQDGLSIPGSEITQSLLINQIIAYEHMGDFRRADVLMEEYIAKYPGDEMAKREYLFLESR